MKSYIFCTSKIILALLLMQAGTQISAKSINVDGDRRDWTGIAPLITDPERDYSGHEDLLGVSVTNDASNVYFLLEYANVVYRFGSRVGNYSLQLDTDLNPDTGCSLFNPGECGSEFLFAFEQLGQRDYVGDFRSCEITTRFDSDLTVAYQENNTFIEFSIPIETLRILSPDTSGFRILTTSDRSDLEVYLLKEVPIPPAIYLFITGLISIISIAKRNKTN